MLRVPWVLPYCITRTTAWKHGGHNPLVSFPRCCYGAKFANIFCEQSGVEGAAVRTEWDENNRALLIVEYTLIRRAVVPNKFSGSISFCRKLPAGPVNSPWTQPTVIEDLNFNSYRNHSRTKSCNEVTIRTAFFFPVNNGNMRGCRNHHEGEGFVGCIQFRIVGFQISYGTGISHIVNRERPVVNYGKSLAKWV